MWCLEEGLVWEEPNDAVTLEAYYINFVSPNIKLPECISLRQQDPLGAFAVPVVTDIGRTPGKENLVL